MLKVLISMLLLRSVALAASPAADFERARENTLIEQRAQEQDAYLRERNLKLSQIFSSNGLDYSSFSESGNYFENQKLVCALVRSPAHSACAASHNCFDSGCASEWRECDDSRDALQCYPRPAQTKTPTRIHPPVKNVVTKQTKKQIRSRDQGNNFRCNGSAELAGCWGS